MKKTGDLCFRLKSLFAVGMTVLTLFSLITLFSSCGCKHNDADLISDSATCVEDGVKRYHCNICGETFEEPSKATGEHNYTISISNKATCTESGYETLQCTTCSQTTKVLRSSLGHNYKGCKCTRCGTIANGYKEVKVNLSGGSFVYKYPGGSGLDAYAYLFDSSYNAVALFCVKLTFSQRSVKAEVTQLQSAYYSIKGTYNVDIYDSKNTRLGSVYLTCTTTYSNNLNSRETTETLSRSPVDGETLYIKITCSN